MELGGYEPYWGWLAIGLILAAAEMAVPGLFLIWMAIAALLTGLAAWLLPIGVPLQILLFAVLAIFAVFGGKRFLRDNPVRPADPMMNDRGARLVGEMVLVTQTIGADGAAGRVKQGDTEWLAKGAEAEPGARMRVTGHDGVVLIVEHVH